MRTRRIPAAAASTVICLLLLTGPGLADGQSIDRRAGVNDPPRSQVGTPWDEALRAAIESRIAEHHGSVGLALVDIKGEKILSIRGEERFPSASVVKVPLMVEVFARAAEGRLGLFDPLTVLGSDRTAGAGVLQYLSTPKEITVWDAVFLMITLSDNTATNLLLEKIRPRAVNARMRSIGLENTEIFVHVGGEADESVYPDSVRRYGFGATTPMDMAALFTRLYRGEVISDEASRQMLGILGRQLLRDGIPRGLPTGTAVFHKTGATDRIRNDCGIVDKPEAPFVICVMTTENADARWTQDNEAERLIADLARIVYDGLTAGPARGEQAHSSVTPTGPALQLQFSNAGRCRVNDADRLFVNTCRTSAGRFSNNRSSYSAMLSNSAWAAAAHASLTDSKTGTLLMSHSLGGTSMPRFRNR